jgi:ABC-type phosphate transport system substrate-binding protein
MLPLIKFRMLLLAATVFAMVNVRGSWQIIVIANPNVKSSSVSKADVRDVFSGSSSTLRDGTRVVPVFHRPGPVQDQFVAIYLGKSDAAFRAGWRSLVMSGQASMPRSLDSDSAVVAYVARTPGSIGYIDSRTSHDGVKVLSVQ